MAIEKKEKSEKTLRLHTAQNYKKYNITQQEELPMPQESLLHH